jgi:hypothetical protein
MGQSFTPGLSAIGFVQMEFSDFPLNGLGSTVYVNLRSTSITGTVVAATDPLTMPDVVPTEVFTFYFTSPAALTAGTTYYLQPVLQSGDGSGGPVGGQFNYSGGVAYDGGFPESGYDLWLREGIVPEPA